MLNCRSTSRKHRTRLFLGSSWGVPAVLFGKTLHFLVRIIGAIFANLEVLACSKPRLILNSVLELEHSADFALLSLCGLLFEVAVLGICAAPGVKRPGFRNRLIPTLLLLLRRLRFLKLTLRPLIFKVLWSLEARFIFHFAQIFLINENSVLVKSGSFAENAWLEGEVLLVAGVQVLGCIEHHPRVQECLVLVWVPLNFKFIK